MEQTIITLWNQLLWPLVRILLLVSLGLLVANFIEALNWTHRLAVLARPLVRLGRLSSITGASFTMAFLSGVSANSMLAEAFDQENISKQELILANLFNSLPRFFLHLPTVFFLTAPLIKGAAFFYVGLTFSAALLQTMLVVIGGRLFLPAVERNVPANLATEQKKRTWREALDLSKKRFKKRIKRLLYFMVPVYVLFFVLSRLGFFSEIEAFIAEKAWFLSWLHPQSLGIVILHVTAEFSAGLAAAGALLADNSLGYREVVLALLAGNILAAPVRAIRHQFPYYMGIFPVKIAMQLVGVSQVFRVMCVLSVTIVYYVISIGT